MRSIQKTALRLWRDMVKRAKAPPHPGIQPLPDLAVSTLDPFLIYHFFADLHRNNPDRPWAAYGRMPPMTPTELGVFRDQVKTDRIYNDAKNAFREQIPILAQHMANFSIDPVRSMVGSAEAANRLEPFFAMQQELERAFGKETMNDPLLRNQFIQENLEIPLSGEDHWMARREKLMQEGLKIRLLDLFKNAMRYIGPIGAIFLATAAVGLAGHALFGSDNRAPSSQPDKDKDKKDQSKKTPSSEEISTKRER